MVLYETFYNVMESPYADLLMRKKNRSLWVDVLIDQTKLQLDFPNEAERAEVIHRIHNRESYYLWGRPSEQIYLPNGPGNTVENYVLRGRNKVRVSTHISHVRSHHSASWQRDRTVLLGSTGLQSVLRPMETSFVFRSLLAIGSDKNANVYADQQI